MAILLLACTKRQATTGQGRKDRAPEARDAGEVAERSEAAEAALAEPSVIRHGQHFRKNEIKYCYEAELAKNPKLAGRIEVQFTISAEGRVIAAVLKSSTMQNRTVESCVVKAVRRWVFPKPQGGGIVIVSYPFNFQPGTPQ